MLTYPWSMWKISPASHHRIQTVLSSISIQHSPTYLSLADFSSHSVITITLRERQEMIRPSQRVPCFIMGILYQSTITNTTLFQQINQKHQPHIHILCLDHIVRAPSLYIYISGGPLSALTCCVNVRLLSAIKKISPLIYSQSWVGSWVYTTQAMMTFTLIF